MVRYPDLHLLLLSFPAIAVSQAPEPSIQSALTATPAIDGVLAAFRNKALVGLSDRHGLAQEEDFYVSLIGDPRFAKQVRNIVVEFGNASQQQTIDRYVNGEDIPYVELRKVWADTSYVGWFPTVTALGYLNFYAAVRAVNQTLPIGQRIHVWLGGKPVDWSKIKTKDDLSKSLGSEPEHYPADLIEEQILSKGSNALIIYGTFHFYDKGSLGDLIRQRHAGALSVITLYTGFDEKSCSDAFERTVLNWPRPAIAPGHGTEFEQRLDASGCHFVDASNFAGMTESQKAQTRSEMQGHSSVIAGNLLLYLGPAETLTRSPLSPDLYLDPEFRKENERRAALFGGAADTWPMVKDNPMSPQYLHSYGGH